MSDGEQSGALVLGTDQYEAAARRVRWKRCYCNYDTMTFLSTNPNGRYEMRFNPLLKDAPLCLGHRHLHCLPTSHSMALTFSRIPMEGDHQNASNGSRAPSRTCSTCQRHFAQDCISTTQVAECVNCAQRERRFASRVGALGGDFAAAAASAAPREVTDTLRDAVNQCGTCHKRLRHPTVSRSVAAAGEKEGGRARF